MRIELKTIIISLVEEEFILKILIEVALLCGNLSRWIVVNKNVVVFLFTTIHHKIYIYFNYLVLVKHTGVSSIDYIH